MKTTLPPLPVANPSKYAVSFGIALAVTSIFDAGLVIAKETNQATVMAWMKKLSGQHWATHSLLSVFLFFTLGLALSRFRGGQGVSLAAPVLLKMIVAGVVAGPLIIFAFYLFCG